MDELRISSKILHPEVQAIDRESVDPRLRTTKGKPRTSFAIQCSPSSANWNVRVWECE